MDNRRKFFGDFFADMPLFFKVWMGLCFGGAFITIGVVIFLAISVATDEKSITYRAGEAFGEIEQGYKDTTRKGN